jgi:hypothetical protein
MNLPAASISRAVLSSAPSDGVNVRADWRTAEWIAAGKRVRAAWRCLLRMRGRMAELDGYPVRLDYPPRVSRDKTVHSSIPERVAERVDQLERELKVTDGAVRRARADLMSVDFEAWLALKSMDMEGLGAERVAEQLSCSRTRVYHLLAEAWGFVAWEIGHEAA